LMSKPSSNHGERLERTLDGNMAIKFMQIKLICDMRRASRAKLARRMHLLYVTSSNKQAWCA